MSKHSVASDMTEDAEEQIARFYAVLVVNKDRIPPDVGLALTEAFHAVVDRLTALVTLWTEGHDA